MARTHERIITYGFGGSNIVRVEIQEATAAGSTFRMTGPQGSIASLRIGVPGRHNVLNATAACLTAGAMGCPQEAIAAALDSYVGARRRFDIRLATEQVAVVDDYAHHPVAVASFVDGLRQRYPDRRLILVFQPHTLARTRALFDEFVAILGTVDEVAVLDVYAGREDGDPAQPAQLAEQLRQALRRSGITLLDTAAPSALVARLAELATGAPVVIGTVGAGDVWKTVTEPLVAQLN